MKVHDQKLAYRLDGEKGKSMDSKSKKELDTLTEQLKNKINAYESMATDTAYELGLFRGKASAYTDCIKWIKRITKEDKSK